MYLQEEYKYYFVSSGQARPYADTRTVYRFEHWEYDGRGVGSLCWPKVREDNKWVPKESAMLERIAVAFNFQNLRTVKEVNHGSIDDHFRGWYEIDYPEPGVILITSISPFTD